MTAELGHVALIVALWVSCIQSIVPLLGVSRGHLQMIAIAQPTAIVAFLLVAAAFLSLTVTFVTSDFSVRLVAEHSHSLKPMLYKISGVWGNHEGSMLLWILILTFFSALVSIFGGRIPKTFQARVLAVQGMIAVSFLFYILGTSNPFLRLIPAPIDGQDLNPLLQDPGLAFHPPFLYLGYVGFSVAFSFSVAALMEGRVDPAWGRWVRPWTLVAWVSLTLGIALGSWWAYYELGWGGWWFWDPVENASFLPWLLGTALLHSALVVEKRATLKTWTILLAMLTFATSLLGTFLVRSGVLTSVHSFATDPTRGVFILILLAITVGGALLLYAWRAPNLRSDVAFEALSREGLLVVNNLLLVVGMLVVLLGTLFPLFTEAFGYKVSVGAPFFNLTFVPLMVPLLMLLPLGPLSSWKKANIQRVSRQLFGALALALITALGVFIAQGGADWIAYAGIALAVWLMVGAIMEPLSRAGLGQVPVKVFVRRLIGLPLGQYGAAVAHFGLGVMVAGIVGISCFSSEKIIAMGPKDQLSIGGYTLSFDGVGKGQGPNYEFLRGRVIVTKDGKNVAELFPEKRLYNVKGMQTTEAAIRFDGMGDLYLALGARQENGKWALRAYYNPGVDYIWFGCFVMAVGGMLSIFGLRYRRHVTQSTKRLVEA
ncbi:MAG: heme lyase CcmF/NrfE family subunit [Alphaproteobacteria bacterium]